MIFSPDVYAPSSNVLNPISSLISSPAHLASASAWLPLTYDTIVVVLTVNRTIKPFRHQNASTIMRVLLRDGLMYYG